MMRYQGIKEPAQSKGYSLIELLMVMAIMAIVIAAVYSLYYTSQKTYTAQDLAVEMQQNARAGIELMSQELRMAGYDPDANRAKANAGIVAATATSIQFTMDLNGNGGTTDANENVSYRFQGGRLERDTGGGWQDIAENILNFQITYFLSADGTYHGVGIGNDDDGDGLTDEAGELLQTNSPDTDPLLAGLDRQTCRNAIRIIRLTLTAQTAQASPETGQFRQFTLTSDINLRNVSFIK